MEVKKEVLIDKWFESHTTLTKENYTTLNEFVIMFNDGKNETQMVKLQPKERKYTRRKKDKRLHTGLGKRVAEVSNVGIYAIPLEEIRQLLLKDKEANVYPVLERFYPNMKRKSYSKYRYSYLNFLKRTDYRLRGIMKSKR